MTGEGREPYQPWTPDKSAARRASWEQSLNTASRYPERSRWDGVTVPELGDDRELER